MRLLILSLSVTFLTSPASAATQTVSLTRADQVKFGKGLAASGEYLFVGAPGNNVSGWQQGNGVVHVYRRNPNGFSRITTFHPGPNHGHGFGTQIAASGDTVVVKTAGPRLLVFRKDPVQESWSHIQTLSYSDVSDFDVSDSFLVIGDHREGGNRGRVVLKPKLADGSFGQGVAFHGTTNSDYFGYRVATDGNWTIATADAPNWALPLGKVLIFEYDGSSWSFNDSYDWGKEFGADIDISGDKFVVGDPTYGCCGAAHVFRYSTTYNRWFSNITISPIGANNQDDLGRSVAISDNTVSFGSDVARRGTTWGVVYNSYYNPSSRDWTALAEYTGSDATNISDDFAAVIAITNDTTFTSGPEKSLLATEGKVYGYRFDADSDGIYDQLDNCSTDANPSQTDSDGDKVGDSCDMCPSENPNDIDEDDTCEANDNCPGEFNPSQTDDDQDGFGNACDPCPNDGTNDPDGDGICDDMDNCIGLANPGQADLDSDGVGDVCDFCPNDFQNDYDQDGHCAGEDNCPYTANQNQLDTDGDGNGDACDTCATGPDDDGDSICDSIDNCPSKANPTQVDRDGDGLGDTCDNHQDCTTDDTDGDSVCDEIDNCPADDNSDQRDGDGDGTGDMCDACPSDPSKDAGECAGNKADEEVGGCSSERAPVAPIAAIMLLGMVVLRRRAID